MRRWTLTLFLMIAAGIAVALAPRLLAAVGVTPTLVIPTPPPVAHDLHVVDTGVVVDEPVQPQRVTVDPAPVAAIPEVPVAPVVKPPPRTRTVDPGLLIPELDEQPGVDWTTVPPPAMPAPDPTFWDDCPGCGMG